MDEKKFIYEFSFEVEFDLYDLRYLKQYKRFPFKIS